MKREWLVTNGLGGYACGTVAGPNSRRYHGLLVAALQPPVKRVVLLAALEEWLIVEGTQPVPLSSQEYWDGTIFPDGYRQLDEIRLDSGLPVFRWSALGRSVEKRIWLEHGSNRTVVRYQLAQGEPARLRLQPLCAHRDYHTHRRGGSSFETLELADGWRMEADGLVCYLQVRPAGVVRSRPDWYWCFLHRAERARGLDDEEDLFTPGAVELPLVEGEPATLVAGVDPLPSDWSAGDSLRSAQARSASAVRAASADGADASATRRQLVLAADQFIVARVGHDLLDASAERRTIIAGYPWFTDWGRDTMISLPGLSLATGRSADARAILATFVGYLDQGMLPNRFPDRGEAPEYNTIDATLWLFQALAAYVEATSDWEFVLNRLEQLEDVIRWHVSGTRYRIGVDPADGLLRGGEEGVALTWMDARSEGRAITPRIGKPVEINALWYGALRLVAEWGRRAGGSGARYDEMAARTQASARARFWYADGGYLYDVVDGPAGDDASLRPNQVLALGLTHPLFDGDRARAVLDVVTDRLLTPYGLRTLSPQDPRYHGQLRGGPLSRDQAYHMGTVWPWLLGPYLDALDRLDPNSDRIQALLGSFDEHLSEAGLGTVSEIFDGDPPHAPVGCIAQAWSVAEILRHLTQRSRAAVA